MYLAIIIFPLLGSIVSGFFGRKIGATGSQMITCTAVILATIFAIVTFFEVGFNNSPVYIQLARWIDSEIVNVGWAFTFDSLTVAMLIPVLIVSSLVHIYSISYMSEDPHIQRFYSYLNLFTFMMIILVTGNNYFVMFVGWEGVGVCSYLLVCFWFTRTAANQSALSAFLTNRVGDCLLTIGMFSLIWGVGNLDYAIVFSLAPDLNEDIVTIISICIVIGAMAKSSQLGLHVWLPMAMEGPTPVSALIHAATMVTAGVYILIRSSPLIEYSSTVLIICLWLGAITTVFSSLVGLFQQDIKKVIAYSTMSQLGMMFIAIGLSSYHLALFHLVNHAFYKALLFLGAGSVIHAAGDNQDFRKYGGLKPFLPLTYTVILVASLSLVAIPYMTGFYSKDLILESAYGQYHISATVVYLVAATAAMFTTLYSVKVLYLTFLTNPNGSLINYNKAHEHEGNIFMTSPLILLAIFSIFFGYVAKDVFVGMGSAFFTDNALFIHPLHEILIDTEFGVPTLFKLLPLFFTISLSVISIFVSEYFTKKSFKVKLSKFGYNIFSYLNQRFFIEHYYNKYVSGLVLWIGGHTTKLIDKGSIENLGPYGLQTGLLELSKSIATISRGFTSVYALYVVSSVTFYIYLSMYFLPFIIWLVILISLSFFVQVNKHFANPFTQYSVTVSFSGFSLKRFFGYFSLKGTNIIKKNKAFSSFNRSIYLILKPLYVLILVLIYMYTGLSFYNADHYSHCAGPNDWERNFTNNNNSLNNIIVTFIGTFVVFGFTYAFRDVILGHQAAPVAVEAVVHDLPDNNFAPDNRPGVPAYNPDVPPMPNHNIDPNLVGREMTPRDRGLLAGRDLINAINMVWSKMHNAHDHLDRLRNLSLLELSYRIPEMETGYNDTTNLVGMCARFIVDSSAYPQADLDKVAGLREIGETAMEVLMKYQQAYLDIREATRSLPL